MKKTKIFQINKRQDAVEAEINALLAENSEKVIVSTAGTNVFLFIIYEE
ncbi:MAG TPA: hypothetical protein VKM55_28670 [Candidatus Lokiarchaeia archaeon]|nr:hypothetical protein [Candidatus Lokiarchaeia archaeon]